MEFCKKTSLANINYGIIIDYKNLISCFRKFFVRSNNRPPRQQYTISVGRAGARFWYRDNDLHTI